jgi:hypothetical protein
MSGKPSPRAASLAIALLAVAAAHGQVRDRPMTPAATATIRGRVVVDDDGTPVRHATVIVSKPPAMVRSGLESSNGPWTATTADDGSFVVRDIAPGAVAIRASKGGFVPGEYRAPRPGRPGASASLDGGSVLDVVLRLGRGAVLAGSIRDAAGAPLEGVSVLAISASSSADELRLQLEPAQVRALLDGRRWDAVTDDRGEFRVYGLPAGDYHVMAMPESGSAGRGVARRSSSEVDEILSRLRLRMPAIARGETPPPVDAAPVRTYSLAPIYYPGTPVRSDAAPLTLATGEERAGLDFVVGIVPMTTIEGTLVTPAGGPPEAAQVIVVAEDVPFASGTSPIRTRAPDVDGRFVYSNVPPGRVRVVARARGYLFGAEIVAAGDAPVVPVTIRLQPGSRVRGRVVVDPSGARERLSPLRIRVGLAPVDAPASLGTVVGGAFVKRTEVGPGPDGTFEFEHLGSGRYRLSVALSKTSGSGWWLRSATLPGRGDVLDALDLALGDDVTDLVLTVTDRPSSLAGTLRTPAGLPASDYSIVVFPADPSLWSRRSRRVRAGRLDERGAFQFDELAGGAYLLAALTDVEPEAWHRPEFLAALRPAAVPVVVVDGQRTVQTLQVRGK